METVSDLSEHGAAVPQASYHIEVSSADGAAPPADPLPLEPVFSPVADGGGGGGGDARSMVLVRCAPDTAAAQGRSVKYVLTGLQTPYNGAAVGVTPVKSPAVATAGQTTSAARARQILKKRLDLSIAEKRYTKMLHPELAGGEGDVDVDPLSDPAAVMICEPEADGAQKQGRTFFFVAKPPDEEEQIKSEDAAVTENETLPDGPAPSEAVTVADLGVLKRLNRFRLSERYEILPAASLEDAEDVMHRLRLQNLALKTEMVRQATEFERHGDEHGLRSRRGRKKATTIVAVDRLRELEKVEAGMHTLFTPSQVKTLSRDYKKNSVQWRDEDFRRAIGLLEHSSQHTFNYVRKVMNLPLPSIGTLKLRCPQQPELCVRLEAALQERGGESRCKHCSRRLSAGPAASQGAAGDAAEEGGYQDIQNLPPDGQQVEWAVDPTPSRGVLKRRKPRGGMTSARKAMRQDEEVVFYEAPVAPPPRGRARGRARGRPRGSGASGVGRSRPGLVSHYQQQPPPEQEEEEEEDDDEDDEPEDDEDFEEEFGEEVEEEGVEIDPQQQEVPTQFAQFRNAYGGGWNEWDPRQLQ